jgi:hypothetical protein
MNGGISLSRKILEWEWYTDANTLRVFLHLILSANWKSSHFRGREIQRGQCITGRVKLARDLKISEREVRTALEHLKMTGEISIETTNQYSVITVVKYSAYQWDGRQSDRQNDQQDDQQTPSDRPTNDRQLATYEKGNKAIKEKSNTEILIEQPQNSISVKLIVELYNEICVSFPKVTSISEARKKQISARWKQYPDIETFRLLFTRAENSSFLKGHNERNWSATFDWMTKDANMPKILEGLYDDKRGAKASGRVGADGGSEATEGSDGNHDVYGNLLL